MLLRFLVALIPSGDLFDHAKHLFVAANQQSLGHALDGNGETGRGPVGGADAITAVRTAGCAARHAPVVPRPPVAIAEGGAFSSSESRLAGQE